MIDEARCYLRTAAVAKPQAAPGQSVHTVDGFVAKVKFAISESSECVSTAASHTDFNSFVADATKVLAALGYGLKATA